MIRITLAEDHDLIRFAVRTLIEAEHDIDLIDEVDSYCELIKSCQLTKPNIILTNLFLKDGEITGKIPELIKLCPLILVLTGSSDTEKHLTALKQGAVGIITKDKNNSLITKAIRTVFQGETWIGRKLATDLWRQMNQSKSGSQDFFPPINATEISLIPCIDPSANQFKLTPRELEVAQLAAQGFPAKKIALELSISSKTVRNQLAVIYSKFNISSHVELVINASKFGLNNPDTESET